MNVKDKSENKKKCNLIVGLGLSILLTGWLFLLFNVHILGHRGEITRIKLSKLREQISHLEGKALANNELQQALAAMSLDVRLNHYRHELKYTNPTNWVVRLIPEEEVTFANKKPFILRLLLFDFYKFHYPEFTLEQKNSKTTVRELIDQI